MEFGQLIQVLSRGHRNEQITGNSRQSGDVFMLHRVFKPGDAGLLQDATGLHGLRELPAFCGVDQDTDIRPHGLSDRLNAACLSFRPRLMAQAHFDGRIPARYMTTG